MTTRKMSFNGKLAEMGVLRPLKVTIKGELRSHHDSSEALFCLQVYGDSSFCIPLTPDMEVEQVPNPPDPVDKDAPVTWTDLEAVLTAVLRQPDVPMTGAQSFRQLINEIKGKISS